METVMRTACVALALLLQTPGDPALEPDGRSGAPCLSADGRYLVFESRASNFDAGDQKDSWDVFLLDRESGSITRVSDDGPLPARSPVISGDGRWILFLQALPARATPAGSWNETEYPWIVVRRAREGGALACIGDGRPTWNREYAPGRPSITRDGALAVFTGTIGQRDVVWCYDASRKALRELPLATNVTDPTARIRLDDPQISADGRFVAFGSTSPQIAEFPADFTGETAFLFHDDAEVFRHELATRKSEYASHFLLAMTGYGGAIRPSISADGRYVAYDNPHDPYTGALHVGFVSDLEERRPGRLLPMREGDEFWQGPACISWLSGDGRRVLVQTQSSAVPGIPSDCRTMQIVLRDLDRDTWDVVTRTPDGNLADDYTSAASASEDASVIAFSSFATNLVENDSNGLADLFLVDRASRLATRVAPRRPAAGDGLAVRASGSEPNDVSCAPSITDDGRLVAFLSLASNFDAADVAETWDVFLADLETGSVRRISNEAHSMVSRPTISPDGRFLAYFSTRGDDRHPAPGDLRVRDLTMGRDRVFEGVLLDGRSYDPPDAPQITRDGSRIAFVGATRENRALPAQGVLLDLRTGGSEILSLGDTGESSRSPVWSVELAGDGRSAGFLCMSAGLAPAWLPSGRFSSVFVGGVNAYVRDVPGRRTHAISEIVGEALGLDVDGFHRKGSCTDLLLSADGSVVVFGVEVTAPGEPESVVGFVARRMGDRFGDLRALVSDPQSFAGSMRVTWLSPEGTHVLVSAHGPGRPFGRTGRFSQVLLGDLTDSSWIPISQNAAGEFANRSATNAVASADLTRIVFESEADNLVPGDTNNARDLFVVDRGKRTIRRLR